MGQLKKPAAYHIIFNDEDIIVVNKLSRLLVHPSSNKSKCTLTSLLEKDLQRKVYPCHRLDRDTTGLMIYGLTKDIQREIMFQFKKRQVEKKYIAFVKGKMYPYKGVLEGTIIDKEGERFGELPKFAKTVYRVLKRHSLFSVIELIPVTGRRNQLRIQLAGINHPILGERKYAFGRDFKIKFRRLALHAYYLKFRHPFSKDTVELEIDLPADMKNFLDIYSLHKH